MTFLISSRQLQRFLEGKSEIIYGCNFIAAVGEDSEIPIIHVIVYACRHYSHPLPALTIGPARTGPMAKAAQKLKSPIA